MNDSFLDIEGVVGGCCTCCDVDGPGIGSVGVLFLPRRGVVNTFNFPPVKSFRLSNGVEKGPFFVLRGGGKGGGTLLESPFGGKGGRTEGN